MVPTQAGHPETEPNRACHSSPNLEYIHGPREWADNDSLLENVGADSLITTTRHAPFNK
jgi:hypothetical protein